MLPEPKDDDGPGWSPARVEMLRLHYGLGLTAEVSARLIGGVSRNAVISKRRRLGLLGVNPRRAAMRIVSSDDDASASRDTRSRMIRRPPPDPANDNTIVRKQRLPFMDWPAPADADPKVLADRRVGECAWPLGSADAPGDYRTLFCCAPAAPGRVYCGVHQARAAAPAEEDFDLATVAVEGMR